MESKVDKHDEDFVNLMEKYRLEAAKNAIDAFNEGYLLGRRHAETVFGEGDNENQG